MPPKLVYLHIGRGKTGTTAIQRFCSRNREILGSRGIHYVRTGDEGGGIGHQEFAQSFLQEIPDWMEVSSRLDRIQDEVRSELLLAEKSVFLFSSENFTLVCPERVKAYFERVFGDVSFKIIFFARSQDELAESQYNQDVKWSGLAASFDDFIATTALEEVDFDVLLTPWAEHFGLRSIIARIYDASKVSVIPDFLSCMSLAVEGMLIDEAADVSNRSVGYPALEILRFLNKFDLRRRRQLYAKIEELLSEDESPAIFFTSAKAREFRLRFRESNRRFSQAYLGRSIDDLDGRRYSDAQRDALLEARSMVLGPQPKG